MVRANHQHFRKTHLKLPKFDARWKLKGKDGTNLSFSRLHPWNTNKIINNVIVPAFLSDANYNYLYPDIKDRRIAVRDRFNYLIPMLNKTKHVNSYMLCDDDQHKYIGHLLLYSPEKDVLHENTTRKFSSQLYKVGNKFQVATRMMLLASAMNNEYRNVNNVIDRYWEISCVSINPWIQSAGYGTLMMSNIHDIIRKENEKTESDYNVPTILFTSTPAALRFYKRLGYRVFMEHNIMNELISYSMIYHHDEKILQYWLNILTENISYYHTVDKYSFIPSFVGNKVRKHQRINNEYPTSYLNHFFEY